MVHQHFMLVPVFTVTENVMLGVESTRGPLRLLDKAAARARIVEISERHRLDVDPDALVEDLPVGVRQRVEIIKTLYRQSNLLILDEPSAVLTPQETEELFGIMRSLQAGGTSIIFITHKLNEVLEIADRITVLRRGKVVGIGGSGRGDPGVAGPDDGRPARRARGREGTGEAGRARPGDRGALGPRRSGPAGRARAGPRRAGGRDRGGGRGPGQRPDRAGRGDHRPAPACRRLHPDQRQRDPPRPPPDLRGGRRARPGGPARGRARPGLHDRREPGPQHLLPQAVRRRRAPPPRRHHGHGHGARRPVRRPHPERVQRGRRTCRAATSRR